MAYEISPDHANATIYRQTEQQIPEVFKTYCSPLIKSHEFIGMGNELLIKRETLNPTGAFKWRGARLAAERALSRNPNIAEFVTASAGNHGAGVAMAGGILGVATVVFAPSKTPEAKRKKLAEFGAIMDFEGDSFEMAYERAINYTSRNPSAHFIHPYDDLDVIRGQGTIGDELAHQLTYDKQTTILVPVGGGGLLAGIAMRIKIQRPDVNVIGVVAEGSDSAIRTFEQTVSNLKYSEYTGGILLSKTDKSLISPRTTIIDATNPNPFVDGVKVSRVGYCAASIFTKCTDGMMIVSSAELGRSYAEQFDRQIELNQGFPGKDLLSFEAEPAGMLARIGAKHLSLLRQATNQCYVALETGTNYCQDTIKALINHYDKA